MSCILNSGHQIGCKTSLGGVKEVYIASYTGDEIFTYDASDVIISATATSNFYTFEQRNQQSEYIETGQHNDNGTNLWQQVVSLVFTKTDADDRNVLKLLAQSRLLVIILDNNGNYRLMGEKNGADLTASTVGAGKAFGDLNGSTISITANEPYPARFIDASVIATLPIS